MRVDVLGPLRVTDSSGADITPDGLLQRRLLALLVLRRGQVVSVDTAVDVLWPAARPRDPVAALQNHVSRLRRALPAGVVESVGDGYRLDPSEVDLDAEQLAVAVAHEDGDVIAAVLERWRGPAYPELADLDDGVVEASRLDELRIRAIEVRAGQRLAAHDSDGLVVELMALADEHPLRERPRQLLMAALAAEGRHAEALRVYDDFRRALGDELGIEPSPMLTAQHAELLTRGSVRAWSPSTRIPVPATSFVGRKTLVGDIVDSVRQHRLVSLVGPGGVGKTRVLVETGHRLLAADPDRPVVMCELAAANEETAVDAVATALAIEARPGIGLADRVAAVLADADVVLLLDNCEHVLDPIAALAERLVAACPRVSLLTSSRERLRLPDERVVIVPPLDVSVADSPAVELFIARAGSVSPGFVPDDHEWELIAEIARRLDGLPLAIELAAARMHMLDLAEVAAGLDDRAALLSSGFRGTARHSSLAAAISWSFGLLDDELRAFFATLSIFSGPFTAVAAAAVGGVDQQTSVRFLHQLAERSLVMRAPNRRYVQLETLRAFGAEQLTTERRHDEAGRRHAMYFLDWIEAADRRLIEPGSGVIAEIDDTIVELRSAMTWLLDHGDVERGGRMVLALMYYGFLRLRPDVLAWAEWVLRADPDDRSPHAPTVWAVASYAAWMSGDQITSNSYRDHARDLVGSTAAAMPVMVAMLCGNNGLIEGRLDEAVAWYRRALDSAGMDRSHRLFTWSTEVLALAYAGDPGVVAAADALLAEVGEQPTPHAAYAWYCAGESDLMIDVDRARRRLQRALDLGHATRASFVIGAAGASLASIEARHGDPHVAADDYRRLIVHWQHAGMWPTQWTMMRSIARLLARLGRDRDAAVLLGAVRATESGHQIFGSDEVALAELGRELERRLGEADFAAATGEGATLDGAGAAAQALRALTG